MDPVKVYVAGKMNKHSGFSSHLWRDDFLGEINKLTGLKFISFDPTQAKKDYSNLEMIFGSDVHMISQVDVLIAYLSEDFGVGGAQEILIAKYFNKPVIALAPVGGKFNGTDVEIAGKIIKNYKHPFVYTTCDVVCEDVQGVAEALKGLDKIPPKSIDIISQLGEKFGQEHLMNKRYEERLIP